MVIEYLPVLVVILAGLWIAVDFWKRITKK